MHLFISPRPVAFLFGHLLWSPPQQVFELRGHWIKKQCATNYTTLLSSLPFLLCVVEVDAGILHCSFTEVLDWTRVLSQPHLFFLSPLPVAIILLFGRQLWSPQQPTFESRTFYLQTSLQPIAPLWHFIRLFVYSPVLWRTKPDSYIIPLPKFLIPESSANTIFFVGNSCSLSISHPQPRFESRTFYLQTNVQPITQLWYFIRLFTYLSILWKTKPTSYIIPKHQSSWLNQSPQPTPSFLSAIPVAYPSSFCSVTNCGVYHSRESNHEPFICKQVYS